MTRYDCVDEGRGLCEYWLWLFAEVSGRCVYGTACRAVRRDDGGTVDMVVGLYS